MAKNNVLRLAKVLSQRTEREMRAILHDILTPAEIEDLNQRLEIIQALMRNEPHRTIAKKVGVSISKVTRGSKAFKTSRFAQNLFRV